VGHASARPSKLVSPSSIRPPPVSQILMPGPVIHLPGRTAGAFRAACALDHAVAHPSAQPARMGQVTGVGKFARLTTARRGAARRVAARQYPRRASHGCLRPACRRRP
jgi:hypothetical protein